MDRLEGLHHDEPGVNRFRRLSACHKNESLPSIVDIIYIDIDRNDIDVDALKSANRWRVYFVSKIQQAAGDHGRRCAISDKLHALLNLSPHERFGERSASRSPDEI